MTENPQVRRDAAHDVLAAEEFGVPAPDPAIGHGPVALPDDPTGISAPHDVLAAEEFALPAGRPAPMAPGATGVDRRSWTARAVMAGLAIAFLVRRLRRPPSGDG